ncbi:MAG TPA: protein-glutamate O-methyltransferase CheR [Aquifex aeolicus]|nr:protein-glutamate O-methyltransferase CheR [Aquifex aeolicus]
MKELMKTEEKEELVELLRKVIYDLTGNFYPDERMKILEYKFERLLKETGITPGGPRDAVSYFLSDAERRKRLINLMTVPETSFFREKEQLDVLFGSVLRGNVSLDICSVGCSTGQEPYTLAMMMAKSNLGGTVIGMDINEEALGKAREGTYRSSELKDIPKDYREFVKVDGEVLRIREDIKGRVRFVYANLIEEDSFKPFHGRFSAVLCRNVLIYFDPPSKKTALLNLKNILRRDGVLVLSSTEILPSEYRDIFKPFKEGRFFFYRRSEA